MDFTKLRRELAGRGCALRIVVFSFPDHDMLQQILQVHPALREPMSDEHTYLFACMLPRDVTSPRASLSGLVAWDPVTLQPTTTGAQQSA